MYIFWCIKDTIYEKKKCTEWKASNVINVRKYKSYASELKFNVGNSTVNKEKEQNCDWCRNITPPTCSFVLYTVCPFYRVPAQ